MSTNTTGLHWFRHDLRIIDNEALLRLSQQTARLVGVYVFDPSWLQQNKWGCQHLGTPRRAFLHAALKDLQSTMRALGSDLLLIEGKPSECLPQLINALNATHISFEQHAGFHEIQQAKGLQTWITHHNARQIKLIKGSSNYLYLQSELPFPLDNMPDTFSPFRRKVEKYATPRAALAGPEKLAGCSADYSDIAYFGLKRISVESIAPTATFNVDDNGYPQGESGALARINDYFFKTDRIAKYKETRNGLDGWHFSSRLSPYLAHGCVSPSTVLARLKEYETTRLANDSTYWLFFELLWREFFHLQHTKHGAKFFAKDGIQSKPPSSRHEKETFEQWCRGNTGYDIVDACMLQLNATGFISNRGRQLVASCFVHELNLDWRYGAAYFEQQLTDFDVASNWGNWQYLAGVGSDPRGHRQFHLQKQTDTYDPQRVFIKKWLAHT